MPTMSVRIPKDLKNEIDDHPEINWSEVIRQSMWKYLRRLELADEIAAKSELTEEEMEKLREEEAGEILEEKYPGLSSIKTAENIDEIVEENHGEGDLTEALLEQRKEEDV